MTRNDDATRPEYAANPFIARLPPILSPAECLTRLRDFPLHHDDERLLPPHFRLHFLGRLLTYFDPNERHLALEHRIDFMIRQGYLGRNPLTTSYYHRLQNDHARMTSGNMKAEAVRMASTANSMTLLGVSGMGKSTSVNNILNRYPESIVHDAPIHVIQVPWVRLECPYKGSVKQLCLSFFKTIDDLLGTDFARKHGGSRSSIDNAVQQMAAIANRHAVGLIVIDEIQHLMEARGTGRDEMLNFLVTLVNHCSTPVMLIGTPKALPLLDGAFRQARRASGFGSVIWDRMPRNKTWDRFVNQLWSCQWTREPTPLTDELSEVLYDESQGIIDVVIKLYMLAQLRLISFSSMKQGPERIDATLLRRTAKEHLGLIRPMIEALRSGDARKVHEYDDLRFLDTDVQAVMQSAYTEIAAGSRHNPPPASPREKKDEKSDRIFDALTALGLTEDEAKLMVRDAKARNPDASPGELQSIVRAMLRGGVVPKRTPPVADRITPKEDPQDMRLISIESTGYAALLANDTIRAPANDRFISDPSFAPFKPKKS